MKISGFEVAGIIVGMISGAVLAIFALIAAIVQRARYLREMIRRVEVYARPKETVVRRSVPSGSLVDSFVLDIDLINQNDEPILIDFRDGTSTYTIRYEDAPYPDKSGDAWQGTIGSAEGVGSGGQIEELSGGATLRLRLSASGSPGQALVDPLDTGQSANIAFRTRIRVSAIPDGLSWLLLFGKDGGHKWVDRNVVVMYVVDPHQVRLSYSNLAAPRQ